MLNNARTLNYFAFQTFKFERYLVKLFLKRVVYTRHER
jgi:hypothetical protein